MNHVPASSPRLARYRRSAVFALLGLVACGPPKPYVAQSAVSTPIGQMAKVVGYSSREPGALIGPTDRITIVEVDGKWTASVENFLTSTSAAPNVVYVPPGHHRLGVLWQEGPVEARGEVTLKAEAGKTYVIRAKREGWFGIVFSVQQEGAPNP